MAKNDGGPAFPVTLEQLECDATGMTRRQLYGLGTMIALLARSSIVWSSDKGTVCREAWAWADALLATEEE